MLIQFKPMQVVGVILQSLQKATERHAGCPENRNDLCLVYNCALLLPQHTSNTDECTHTLLKNHFINPKCHSDMFQPLKDHPQGIPFIHWSSNLKKIGYQI